MLYEVITFLESYEDSQLRELEQLLAQKDAACVAVGECGLDGMVDVDVSIQEKVFTAQLLLATQARITSYNVCYTKLLRLGFVLASQALVIVGAVDTDVTFNVLAEFGVKSARHQTGQTTQVER